MKQAGLLAIGYLLAVLGAGVKLYGALAAVSKSLLVDALTCIANLAAGALAVYFTLASLRPPDTDHPYGHGRLVVAASILNVLIYSFVAGIAFIELLDYQPYRVDITAPVYAALGFAFYAAAILILRKMSYALAVYSELSVTELVESGVTVAASYGGATMSYLIDYGGAVALFAYLVYELVKHSRGLTHTVTDYAPPELVREVTRFMESQGLKVCSIRLRTFVPGIYWGDAVVAVAEKDIERAHALVDAVEKMIEKRYGVRILIHYEPGGCS